ncbi:hypothetical protein SAY86_018139 [Trapa natans]|uniref:Uncharacterized protein n=1 Tax=Trapa natans TaxID=22666 RepID=A0AAN7LMW1_TRANT|nr:hypothetical protein SAY86_018139 [Trapa natans]
MAAGSITYNSHVIVFGQYGPSKHHEPNGTKHEGVQAGGFCPTRLPPPFFNDFLAEERDLDMGTEVNGSAHASEDVEALLDAARYGYLEDVTSLAAVGVGLDSKDEYGRTALHMAAANGHVGIVSFLISKGVDINAINEEKNTPLHWACLNGHVQVVKDLILAGANASMLNSHDRTPVDEAVSRGKLEVMDAINEAATQAELNSANVF